jgi:hypothetical protein
MRKNKGAAPMLANEAPGSDTLTDYDEEHLITYRGLLDAEREGAEWDEAALLVLSIDPIREPARARRAWETHLARAKWLAEHGLWSTSLRGVPN